MELPLSGTTDFEGERGLAAFGEAARDRGFFAWGAAQAAEVEDRDLYLSYLREGRNGGMAYLAKRTELRLDPRLLLPGARTVLVLLRSYRWPPPAVPEGHVRVATYARGADYHESMRRDLESLASMLIGFTTRVCVDTAPLLERYWARKCGLASLGKNTCCLRRDAGSMFFIGIILTAAPFPPTGGQEEDLCGDCSLCIEACPTAALVAPYTLDATRCLSYLTIEHRGAIPREARAAMGDVIFGCDRCQEACPINLAASIAGHPDFRPRPPFSAPSLPDLLALEEEAFRSIARSSAIGRATRRMIQRNCLVAASNLGSRRAIERFMAWTGDPDARGLAAELLRQ